jgi:hypothetical protein
MEDNIERTIMERIERPGWIATRGVLQDPTGQQDGDEYQKVEAVMRDLAAKGKVRLWRLIMQQDNAELMAAAKLDLELDKELESKGAWATAKPYDD